MILKGRTRAHGQQLATYLLSEKNEEVRVLDVRGTVITDASANGLKQSLKDMDELGKATRAQSSLFHLAINPNDRDQLTREDWQHAVAKAEKALGLEEQPRAIVSHLHNGKEHWHVVWSRVDVEACRCVEMSFSNRKLCRTAREIEQELGLELTAERPEGTRRAAPKKGEHEKHQDERGVTPRQQRDAIIQRAWEQTQNGQQFKQRLDRAGYRLAQGRRGVVVLDAEGEAHSISRSVRGIRAKDVRAKLADVGALPAVEELRQQQAAEPRRRRAQHLTKSHFEGEGATPANDNAAAREGETWQEYKARNQQLLEEQERQREAERRRSGWGREL